MLSTLFTLFIQHRDCKNCHLFYTKRELAFINRTRTIIEEIILKYFGSGDTLIKADSFHEVELSIGRVHELNYYYSFISGVDRYENRVERDNEEAITSLSLQESALRQNRNAD